MKLEMCHLTLQQSLPFTVLKLISIQMLRKAYHCCCNSPYRLRYWNAPITAEEHRNTVACCNSPYRLRYWNQPAKLNVMKSCCCNSTYRLRYWNQLIYFHSLPSCWLSCNSAYRSRYWNKGLILWLICLVNSLQQCLPFTVCAEGCETAEEQSDDEVRTSQVPERSEGKTKVIRQQHLPFTVLKPTMDIFTPLSIIESCNSTYRSRYAPKGARQQRSRATMKSAHLKYLSEARVKQRW